MDTKSYLIELSYGGRMSEIQFISDILSRFDNETLTGITVLVNNNPYNLEFLLFLAFEKCDVDFDAWITNHYPDKRMNYLFNYSISDVIENLSNKRYNCHSFLDAEDVKRVITDNPNFIFLWPSFENIQKIWGKWDKVFKFKVFLSHSSIDKPIVEKIFFELQKEEIKVWFDKYEIKGGDSITDKLNEGLSKSDLGLICLSRNFLNSNSSKAEMNYFFRQRMISGKKNFIILNIDLSIQEFPPLLQDYRHINLNNENSISELLGAIKEVNRQNI